MGRLLPSKVQHLNRVVKAASVRQAVLLGRSEFLIAHPTAMPRVNLQKEEHYSFR